MIFVTGATGFLGRHLIPALCKQGISVRVLTRHANIHHWLNHYANVEIVEGDVTNPVDVRYGINGCDTVIHAAGIFRFWGDSHIFDETNKLGTENVLRAAVEAGVQRFIHISTIAVVGGTTSSEEVIDETHLPSPADPYQRSKLAAENLALQYCYEYGLPVIVLRPGAYYGPLGSYGFNRLFFKDPMRGIIMQVDAGKHIIFPVFISDVAQAILLAIKHGRPGEVYNICGDSLSHKETFDIICDLADIRFPRLSIMGGIALTTSRVLTALSELTKQEPFWPINMRSYVFNDWRVSSKKAREELGFVPTSFYDGAKRTIQWYQEGQPDILSEFDC